MDALGENWRQIYKDTVKQAEDLCEVVDPPEKPFQSKYKAQDALDFVVSAMGVRAKQACKEEEQRDLKLCAAFARHKLGVISFDTEDFTKAVEYLDLAAETLQEEYLKMTKEDHTKFSHERVKLLYALLDTMNHLGIIWGNREQNEKSLEQLQGSEKIYLNAHVSIKQTNFELSGENATLWLKVEQVHTMTLFFLAQVFGSLGASEQSATYCLLTLRRQLDNDTYDPVEWSKNCIGVGDYYTSVGAMSEALDCLSAATKMFPEEKENDNLEEKRARIDISWGRMYLVALRISRNRDLELEALKREHPEEAKNRLLAEQKDEQQQLDNALTQEKDEQEKRLKLRLAKRKEIAESVRGKTATEILEEKLKGEGPDSHNESLFEAIKAKMHEESTDIRIVREASDGNVSQDITDVAIVDGLFGKLSLTDTPVPKIANTYEGARLLFLEAMKYYEKALKFFILDGYVTDHIYLLQDMSSLYKNLSYFEKDNSRKLIMQKRRINYFEELLKELNPQAYLGLYKQLTLEMGEIYGEMCDIRHEEANADSNATLKKLKRVSDNAKLAIEWYNKFFEAYAELQEDHKSRKHPDKYPDDEVGNVMKAKFELGRMYGRLLPDVPGPDAVIADVEKQKAEFDWVIAYHEKHPVESFVEEVKCAKEMVSLLPLKIANIRETFKKNQAK